MHQQLAGARPGTHLAPACPSLPAALPLMGILVWPSRISRLIDGQAVPSIELAAKAARQVGVNLYFFCTADVDLRARRINGWRQQVDGTWSQLDMPWPDIFHPAIEIRNKQGQRIWDALAKTTRLVNSHYVLSKWEVYQALSNFSQMQPYMPETVVYRHPSDLKVMLDRHHSILAKPCYGLGAMNISKVWHTEGNLYGWEDSSTGTRLTEVSFQRMLEKVIDNTNDPFVYRKS